MTIAEMLVLLPCHSLEDFPTHLESAEAADLLACCTALWHPALIHQVRKLPTWCRADVPPGEMGGRLLVVPAASESWLPYDFADRVEADRPLVLRGIHDRTALTEEAIQLAGITTTFDAQTIADFFALGFCRLHVELLTRMSRYTTSIDDIRLETDVLRAIDAALAGNTAEVRQILTRCFEQLCESRRYFFPIDPYLIDLTLVADSTLGESLRTEVRGSLAKNLLLSGEVLERMAAQEPASIEAIQQAMERETLGIVGGEYAEREFPLLPEETWRTELLRGIDIYQRVLGKRPTVYGRRRAGLSPLLPQLLCKTGFQALLHFTLDDGRFPTSHGAKVRWGNYETGLVEAIGQIPVDAAQATSMLELPRRLGESLDREQVATHVFAHWPGATSIWYQDLLRGSQFAPVLGNFVTLDDYFANTMTASDSATFEADDYRTPYLQQDVAAGCERPISRFADEHQQHLHAFSRQICTMLKEPLAHTAGDPAQPDHRNRLVLNPLLAPVTRTITLPTGTNLPQRSTEVLAVQTGDDGVAGATVRIPGMGFACVASGRVATASPTGTPMIEGTTLRNEFCEVSVDPVTGSIRSIYTANSRGNRLSQQIALRLPGPPQAAGSQWQDPDDLADYSVMAADAVEANQSGGVAGTIVSRGRIINRKGIKLAAFEQRTSLALGSPMVEIEIDLDPEILPGADPWDYYYAARFAFPDVDLTWSRGTSLGPVRTEGVRIEAPAYVEATAARWRTAIFTGGLPYHRVVKGRTLDSLLIVHGETCRRFKLAVAFDQPNPALTALARLVTCESWGIRDAIAATLPPSGWFFHVGSRSVVATGWEPLEDGRGFTARLRETAGAGGQICLQSWQPVATARQTDFLGNTLCELTCAHDKIWLDVKPFDWIQIEVRFAGS